MASAGFEPANLGTKGQHATSRPPKPLNTGLHSQYLASAEMGAPEKEGEGADGRKPPSPQIEI